jgi:hypothetical protein
VEEKTGVTSTSAQFNGAKGEHLKGASLGLVARISMEEEPDLAA